MNLKMQRKKWIKKRSHLKKAISKASARAEKNQTVLKCLGTPRNHSWKLSSTSKLDFWKVWLSFLVIFLIHHTTHIHTYKTKKTKPLKDEHVRVHSVKRSISATVTVVYSQGK